MFIASPDKSGLAILFEWDEKTFQESVVVAYQHMNSWQTTAPTGEPPKVLWDDTRMRSTYANITDVRGSREEITILFGIEEARHIGQNEVRVQLSNKVVLSPFVAKKMAILLNRIVRNYEKGWRSLETEISVEKARVLLQCVTVLDAKISFERSFKVIQRQLFDKRFLLGINRQEIGDKSDEQVTSICEAIDIPTNLFEDFKRYLPDANHIYLGFEDNGKTVLYKVYLEFRDRIEEEIRERDIGATSFLLHLGFKWDLEDSTRQTTTRYMWYPSLPVKDILARLRNIMDPRRHGDLLETVGGIIDQASARISHNDIQYLEVTEEDNPRKSFDINIYKAQLRVRDLYPLLLKTMKHYAIPLEKFQPFYETIKTNRFGHLAGGIDREDRDFLTMYHGVKYLDSHHSQFGY